MFVAAKQATKLPDNPQLAFCYDVLNKVSRRWVRCCSGGVSPPVGPPSTDQQKAIASPSLAVSRRTFCCAAALLW